MVLNSDSAICTGKDECYVPYEVIKAPDFTVSVFGVLGDSRATTPQTRITVTESGYGEGDVPSEPTPTEYEQLLSIANETKQIAQSVRDDADSGAFKGDKGDIGPQGEKGDKGDTGEQGIQGIQGIKGDKGDKGERGYPFTYEDFTPEQLASLKGNDGADGTDGYTPQKGVDYFTDEDIAGLNIPKVDQNYNPDSENPQSGKAVTEAVAIEQNRADYTYANALKGNASGFEILVDDVSPVTHEMGVRVRSKNLLNLQGRIEAVSNGYSPSTVRTLTGNQLFVGFSNGNHWLGMPAGIASYSIEENKVEVATKNSSYGIGFDISIKPGTNYKYSYSTTEDTSDIRAALYTADGVFTRTVGYKTNGFTTTEEEYWAIIIFTSPTLNKAASYTNIQFEENSTATDYTPCVNDLTKVKLIKSGDTGDVISEYIPLADGTVKNVRSIYPSTILTTDTEGILINCTYNRNINKVIDKMVSEISALGGNI